MFWKSLLHFFFNKTKYSDAIEAIKKDILYMPIELKIKLEKENIFL